VGGVMKDIANNKVLLQYSGGKDSTACLIKLLSDNYLVEAIHFTHMCSYEIPTQEATRFCNKFNIKLTIINIEEELKSLLCSEDGFFGRPCRDCKSIMDKKTVKYADENNFELICVGDTKSDATLVNRIKENGDTNLFISKYFNKKVILPKKIYIFRPLVEMSNDDVINYLNENKIQLKRVGDTGDKYFSYSREGCPLQFKDYGIAFNDSLMKKLHQYNTLLSSYAKQNDFKATIHLPSETIVTIPKGFENDCYNFLTQNHIKLKAKVNKNYWITSVLIKVYPELINNQFLKEVSLRLLERLEYNVLKIDTTSDLLLFTFDDGTIKLSANKDIDIIHYTIESLSKIRKEIIEGLIIEIFHTHDYSVSSLNIYNKNL